MPPRQSLPRRAGSGAHAAGEVESCCAEVGRTNTEAQEYELVALKSIFDADLVLESDKCGEDVRGRGSAPQKGILTVRAEPRQIHVCLTGGRTRNGAESSKVASEVETWFDVKFLPPFIMRFVMPPSYPTESPVDFELECCWLTSSQICDLKQHLRSIWESERDVVLYAWADFLQTEALNLLCVDDTLLIPVDEVPRPGGSTSDAVAAADRNRSGFPSRLTRDNFPGDEEGTSAAAILGRRVENYNRAELQREFDEGCYECGICFVDKPGVRCVSLEACGHVFCLDCVRGYYGMLIDEGSLNRITCPEPSCVPRNPSEVETKNGALLSPQELLRIVGKEKFHRYQVLSEKQFIEGSPLASLCPRPACQWLFISDGSHDQKLAVCPNCSYAFCRICRASWHGNAAYCKVGNMNRIAVEYLNAPDEGVKRKLEHRYGKKTLEKLVNAYMDESSLRDWVSQNTQSCPNCSTPIERSTGCSHMTCTVCQTHFCFLCGSVLSKDNPYAHYNNVKSPCNKRLFEGTVPDHDEREVPAWEDDDGPAMIELLHGLELD